LYGGTFNPVHLGHLRAAEEVAEALGLERVLFIPSHAPPHKAPDPDDALAPAALRLEWVRRAVADNARFGVDPVEVERPGPSYLVDTLRALAPRFAPARPVFVVGCDAFAEMGSWRDPEALFALAHYAVTTRPPVRRGSLGDWLPDAVKERIEIAPDGRSGRHREADTWIRLIEITGYDISSSDVRRRLREGRSVRYLLPEAVREAVLRSGCYREGSCRGSCRESG
jgi:nicotinate-nucleotide adenylyltransferase